MLRFLRVFVVSCIVVLTTQNGYTQESKAYDGEHVDYYRGEDLYDKEQYSAALKVFSEYLKDRYYHNQFTQKARYYEAMCVLRLYQNNSEQYILNFIRDYPESIYTVDLYLELAQYYYQKRKFKDAIRFYEKVSPFKLTAEKFSEYHFKLGYAYFSEKNNTEAKEHFYIIKDSSSSQYGAPATYYYGHINYDDKKYQAALESFISLKEHATFGTVVPYYITQIYYLQGNYDALLEYAPHIEDGDNQVREAEKARLIGDAYYRIEKYDEALPYLSKFQAIGEPGRNDNYQIGYSYLRTDEFERAAQYLSYVTQPKDSLAQIALYQMGIAYEKSDQNEYAKNAYEEASKMSFDAAIEEDALYRYAILAYKMDFNPYQDAIKAFTKYINQYPNSKRKKEIYQYLVNVYTTTKNYRAALESLNEMNHLDYPMQQAFQLVAYNHAIEQYESQQYAKAITTFDMVKRYPIDVDLNAKSLFWKASAHHKLKQYDQAIRFYREFMKEPGAYSLPFHAEANYQIGYAYFELQQYTNAIPAFRTYSQSEDKNPELKKEALLRTADSYFLLTNDAQAILFYKEARAMKIGVDDYAIYQSARAKGYAEKFDEKLDDLFDIVNNYSQSLYRVKSIYEIAETYLKDLGDRQKALKYYNQLVVDYPSSLLVKPSLFEIGGIYLQEEEYKQSEDTFLRILNEYDDQNSQKLALNRLKDVYIGMGDPDKFYALSDQYSFSNVTTSGKDSISYNVAYRAYLDSNCTKAISGFSKYIEQFPDPIFGAEAHYYRAACYWANEEREKAHEDYKEILKLSDNEFTENSLLRASRNEYDKKHYDEALQYYSRLEKAATFESNILVAQIGQMRCQHYLKNYQFADEYADKVLASEQISPTIEMEAYYVRGLALKEMNQLEEAIPDLKKCSELNAGVLGAETHYNLAEVYHLTGDFTHAENEIKKIVKERSSFQYWVGKSFVLLGKNLIEVENYFQARHTLESVLNNYNNDNDGVKVAAQEALDYLNELEAEKASKSKALKDETIIEINEEEGNDEE